MVIDNSSLHTALSMLDGRLRVNAAQPVRLVVCGGSALIAMNLILRTTNDVDVVALVDAEERLVSSIPLPEHLKRAVEEVALALKLPQNWLNSGPGDLFDSGLPAGLLGRAARRDYGSHLSVYFISRIDQIFFKVYAAADRMGVHVDDLKALKPTDEEIWKAAEWCMKNDPSEGFRGIILSMLRELGYNDAAERL